MASAIVSALPLLLKLVRAAKSAIPAGTDAINGWNELEAKLKQFQAEGREPTVAEFHELQAETDRLTDRLEAANRRLGGH